MNRPLLGAVSRLAARAHASRFAKPLARAALVAAGLALLAVIGRAAGTGSVTPTSALAAAPPQSSAQALVTRPAPAAGADAVPVVASSPAPAASPPTSRGPASPDDPVLLNSASVEDLRRLPGIGEKRAAAIIALRTHLGRLRAIEDLMKVKGIGRATLKRLRPLVRLDAPADAGAS
jgi:competence protein ComEA